MLSNFMLILYETIEMEGYKLVTDMWTGFGLTQTVEYVKSQSQNIQLELLKTYAEKITKKMHKIQIMEISKVMKQKTNHAEQNRKRYVRKVKKLDTSMLDLLKTYTDKYISVGDSGSDSEGSDSENSESADSSDVNDEFKFGQGYEKQRCPEWCECENCSKTCCPVWDECERCYKA